MEVQERVGLVRERIAAACDRSGRRVGQIHLLGASKRQSIHRMQEAWKAGVRLFGENRVQEAEAKIPEMSPEANWHLIGPLQSNKARKAASLFSTVHSVDRLKIGRALEREADLLGRTLYGFLEINIGGEESKHGFRPERLHEQVHPLADQGRLRIVGLMAIPPWETDAVAQRGWFRRLRELRDDLFARPEWQDRPGLLSMGMSSDFDIAIEEGATHIRVGTALFGPRPDPPTVPA